MGLEDVMEQIRGEEAMEMFKLIKANNLLPTKMEDLVPLTFIGQAAVSFYRSTIKAMDQLKMTENQRKATLKDGQEAGEMLLDIETRIGELLPDPKEALKMGGKRGRAIQLGERPKEVHGGLSIRRACQARSIKNHPETVEKVKAQARENEDIPTRTAVLNAIHYEQQKKIQEKIETGKAESKAIMSMEESLYLMALETVITKLPKQPPKNWSADGLKQAKAYAKIIIKRLEVFVNG